MYSDDDGDDDEDDDDDDDENDPTGKEKLLNKQPRRSKRLFSNRMETNISANGKYKLLEMDFMKKASEIKQHQARQEAQDILKELAGMESDNSDENEDSDDGTKDKKTGRKDTEKALKDAEDPSAVC